MKVLTVRQPWAWAIARGGKDIENRRWTTTHRGPLAIHAAATAGPDQLAAVRFIRRLVPADVLPASVGDDRPYTEQGRVVAVVELVEVCKAGLSGQPCECGPWAMPGQAHWRLAHARPVTGPVLRGQLGLWEYELRALAGLVGEG